MKGEFTASCSTGRRVKVADAIGATTACICCGVSCEQRGEDDPWQGRLNSYCDECSWARCDTSDGECPNRPSRKMRGRSRSQLRASLIAARRQQRRNDENVRRVVEENGRLREALRKHWTWGQYERSLESEGEGAP